MAAAAPVISAGNSVSTTRQSVVASGRPHCVNVDRERRDSRTRTSDSEREGRVGVGFLLRKQNSASTIPLRNQTRPETVSVNRTSCSTLVVDMVGDDEITAMTAATASTQSLTSRNDDEDDDRVTDAQCESAL